MTATPDRRFLARTLLAEAERYTAAQRIVRDRLLELVEAGENDQAAALLRRWNDEPVTAIARGL